VGGTDGCGSPMARGVGAHDAAPRGAPAHFSDNLPTTFRQPSDGWSAAEADLGESPQGDASLQGCRNLKFMQLDYCMIACSCRTNTYITNPNRCMIYIMLVLHKVCMYAIMH
jgi:hypothetical protein